MGPEAAVAVAEGYAVLVCPQDGFVIRCAASGVGYVAEGICLGGRLGATSGPPEHGHDLCSGGECVGFEAAVFIPADYALVHCPDYRVVINTVRAHVWEYRLDITPCVYPVAHISYPVGEPYFAIGNSGRIVHIAVNMLRGGRVGNVDIGPYREVHCGTGAETVCICAYSGVYIALYSRLELAAEVLIDCLLEAGDIYKRFREIAAVDKAVVCLNLHIPGRAEA